MRREWTQNQLLDLPNKMKQDGLDGIAKNKLQGSRLWQCCYFSEPAHVLWGLPGSSLETSLFNPAMMPRGSPAIQTLLCSEPLSFLASTDALHRSWCDSAPSLGTKRVFVNWQLQRGLLSFLYIKRLCFCAVVTLLKIKSFDSWGGGREC